MYLNLLMNYPRYFTEELSEHSSEIAEYLDKVLDLAYVELQSAIDHQHSQNHLKQYQIVNDLGTLNISIHDAYQGFLKFLSVPNRIVIHFQPEIEQLPSGMMDVCDAEVTTELLLPKTDSKVRFTYNILIGKLTEFEVINTSDPDKEV